MANPTKPSLSDAREMKRRMHSTKNSDRKPHADFPTPQRLANLIVEWADLHGKPNGDFRVLEPSAGEGRFVEAVARKMLNNEWIDRVHVVAVEYDSMNTELLKETCSLAVTVGSNYTKNRKHSLSTAVYSPCNFLTWKGDDPLLVNGEKFDMVLMNPPFKGGEWLKHFTHAFELLADDGGMMAILPESAPAKIEKMLVDSTWEVTYMHPGSFEESGAKFIGTVLVEVKDKVCDFMRLPGPQLNIAGARRIRELTRVILNHNLAQCNGWDDRSHTKPDLHGHNRIQYEMEDDDGNDGRDEIARQKAVDELQSLLSGMGFHHIEISRSNCAYPVQVYTDEYRYTLVEPANELDPMDRLDKFDWRDAEYWQREASWAFDETPLDALAADVEEALDQPDPEPVATPEPVEVVRQPSLF